MSWSRSLVKQNIEEYKDSLTKISNQDKKIDEFVVFDFNDYFLFDEDLSPYIIIGENLKSKLGDYIEIDSNLSQITYCEYQDSEYQVFNLKLVPIFKAGDTVKETATGATYKIQEVLPHCYKITFNNGDEVEEGFIGIHMQTRLQLE